MTLDKDNTNCCNTKDDSVSSVVSTSCLVGGHKNKQVQLITIKSLLVPSKLAEIDPSQTYYFCKDADCDVVYFSQSQQFMKQDLKVEVYQKEVADDVPICYCFGWTAKLIEASTNMNEISASITEHIQAGRCGCEVNNPQGSCCLGNINAEIKRIVEERYTL